MKRSEILHFIRTHPRAVEASVSPYGSPQAAVVGVAVCDDFTLVFDTLASSRKTANLRNDGRIALVMGGASEGDQCTLQYEGVADEPVGVELERVKEIYFTQFPDGRERERWPGMIYWRVRPLWIRFSDFSKTPWEIVALNSGEISALTKQEN